MCSIINRSSKGIEIDIELIASEDYAFVSVESFGVVKSYSPTLLKYGRTHHSYVSSDSEIALRFPIAPYGNTRQSITVVLVLHSQVNIFLR